MADMMSSDPIIPADDDENDHVGEAIISRMCKNEDVQRKESKRALFTLKPCYGVPTATDETMTRVKKVWEAWYVRIMKRQLKDPPDENMVVRFLHTVVLNPFRRYH